MQLRSYAKGNTLMTLTIEAVYEGGVLKPFTALDLAEHQHVVINVITVAEVDDEANPTAAIFPGNESPGMDEEINRAIAALRAQTFAKVAQLAKARLSPGTSISLQGLWSHIDPDELDAAFADVRSETNRKLQRLANAL